MKNDQDPKERAKSAPKADTRVDDTHVTVIRLNGTQTVYVLTPAEAVDRARELSAAMLTTVVIVIAGRTFYTFSGGSLVRRRRWDDFFSGSAYNDAAHKLWRQVDALL